MPVESIVESCKYYKRNKVLNIIRFQSQVSRFEIKKLTAYSMATVLSLIDELIADRLVYEEACLESRVGRKPQWLRINPAGAYFMGVEFNRQELNAAMINFAGEIVFTAHSPLQKEDKPERILELVRRHFLDALASSGCDPRRVLGIGLGLPGYFDAERGIATHYDRMSAWNNVPVRQWIETECQTTCLIGNNVTMMALAYQWLKNQNAAEDFLFVSVRTGARVVPVMNGMPFLSQKGYAGQLGHLKVPGSNRLCSCGKRGCLNAEISETAIVSKMIEGILLGRFPEIEALAGHDLNAVSLDGFIRSVRQGHADSLALLRDTGIILGHALGSIIDIMPPDRIVLAGDIFQTAPPIIEAVAAGVQANCLADNFQNLQISVSTFGHESGAVGAAALVMQDRFKFIDQHV